MAPVGVRPVVQGGVRAAVQRLADLPPVALAGEHAVIQHGGRTARTDQARKKATAPYRSTWRMSPTISRFLRVLSGIRRAGN
jgi:hypothetical protein